MAKYEQVITDSVLRELKRALSELKISQAQIGDGLGLKQSAVSLLLSGKTSMNIEQFLLLCGMARVRPGQVLQKSEESLLKSSLMTPEMEGTLYRSALHLVCYAACVIEVRAEDLKLGAYKIQEACIAMQDLVSVGLLKELKNGAFVQVDPRMARSFSDRRRSTAPHLEVIGHSMKNFDLHHEDMAWKSTKFNYYFLDRFSRIQAKEIETAMWKVFDVINRIRQENVVNGYQSSEKLQLMNVHIMLSPPFDERD